MVTPRPSLLRTLTLLTGTLCACLFLASCGGKRYATVADYTHAHPYTKDSGSSFQVDLSKIDLNTATPEQFEAAKTYTHTFQDAVPSITPGGAYSTFIRTDTIIATPDGKILEFTRNEGF